MNVTYYGIKTNIINLFDNLVSKFQDYSLKSEAAPLQDADVIAISSKVVAMEQGRVIDLKNYKYSKKAKKLSSLTNLSPEFVELVLNEAEEVLGTSTGALLTLSNNLLQANAGVDKSNSGGENKAILLPENPNDYANQFKFQIEKQFNLKDIGVIIVDSCTRPLRRGTLGLAIGTAGIPAAIDERGCRDLFGYEMKITFRALADNIASGCNILMGESSESTPFVVIRGLPVIEYQWNKLDEVDPVISPELCLFLSNFHLTRL